MSTVLKIENLTKYYGSRAVVNDISLSVEEGEILGFLGPNGSGKTTTIKMITGLLIPHNGKITVCGYDLESEFEQALENIGGIVENPDMYKELSGLCNLQMAARMHGNISKERINEVVKTVGLENRINDKVKKYSLGMKQRLGVAIAMLHNPKLLVFDEPTNGLDPKGIKEFRDTVKKAAHENGAAVFISSHMMSEMQLICDKVAIIENGRLIGIEDVKKVVEGVQSSLFKIIVSDGEKATAFINDNTVYEIKQTEKSDFAGGNATAVTVALASDDIPALVAKLSENGVGIYSVQPVENSLEDAYINITGGGKIE